MEHILRSWGDVIREAFFAQQGASGKWRRLPRLQSSHLMFPITAPIAARQASCLTAMDGPFFFFFLEVLVSFG